jgi:hypothetical protein
MTLTVAELIAPRQVTCAAIDCRQSSFGHGRIIDEQQGPNGRSCRLRRITSAHSAECARDRQLWRGHVHPVPRDLAEQGSTGRPKQNCQYSMPSSARRPSSEYMNTHAISFRTIRTPWSRVDWRPCLLGVLALVELFEEVSSSPKGFTLGQCPLRHAAQNARSGAGCPAHLSADMALRATSELHGGQPFRPLPTPIDSSISLDDIKTTTWQ